MCFLLPIAISIDLDISADVLRNACGLFECWNKLEPCELKYANASNDVIY